MRLKRACENETKPVDYPLIDISFFSTVDNLQTDPHVDLDATVYSRLSHVKGVRVDVACFEQLQLVEKHGLHSSVGRF